ncbi:MAG TPA: hypothetical protein VFU14_05145 [Acidimicrobiales bacterium]|nr:hypothetical protein [Acidimicrobiales bacterium]
MTEDDQTPTADPRPRRTVPAGAFVVALMVAMALGVLAVVALTMDGDGGGDGAADREIRLAAGRFAERFLTFEHDALDEWKDDVLDLSTGGFAEEVEDVESGLRSLIAESELDAVTQVTDIFVGEEERGGVEVVVVYDRDLTGGELARSETDRYVQLALLRIDGEWLVDNVVDIATSGDMGGGGAEPAAPAEGGDEPPEEPPTSSPTTSTTAPAAGGEG